ncbi:hypothetical protein ABDI30_11615 [Paenibacillus cisolokensis]|uniref:hypothetical protein n=1 Tax=Paenibacillus cisolokensis TaxID=1658519 RepID=UPI003D27BAC6
MKVIRKFKEFAWERPVGLDLDTFQEKQLDQEEDVEYCRGFYMLHNNVMIGIVATDEGPAFFSNGKVYLLKEKGFRFVLKSSGDSNNFTFMWEGQVEFHVNYLRSWIQGGGKQASESSVDFYSWLCEAAAMKRFYSFYTVKNVKARELFATLMTHPPAHTKVV